MRVTARRLLDRSPVKSVLIGLVAWSAGIAQAGYLVELASGDRVTVDTYWRDGDRVHLVQGGVDRTVPAAEIRSAHADTALEPLPPTRKPAAAPATPATASSLADLDDATLAAKQRAVEHHLLGAQQKRFEAAARGDSDADKARLVRAFEHAQQRRHDLIVERERRSR